MKVKGDGAAGQTLGRNAYELPHQAEDWEMHVYEDNECEDLSHEPRGYTFCRFRHIVSGYNRNVLVLA